MFTGQEATNVCHVNEHPDLSGITALPAEIGARDDMYSTVCVNVCVVRNELGVDNKLLKRVPAISDVNYLLGCVNYSRPDEIEIRRAVGKRQDAVEFRESPERFSQIRLTIKNVIFELAHNHAFGVFDVSLQITILFVKMRHFGILEKGVVVLHENEIEIWWQALELLRRFAVPVLTLVEMEEESKLNARILGMMS